MTIDEALKGLIKEAKETRDIMPFWKSKDEKHYKELEELAKYYEQLAEWLRELQELRAKHWDECRQIAHYDDELKEAKRLLKSAANVLKFIPCDEDYNCSECIKQRQNCDYDDSFKWRYLDEALKLIGDE